MVVALGPGRFYGSGLPRPRVFPGDRVDPPAPVTDPLLAWAREAHWSMGGLSSKRLRLQGRIEGNLFKLRRTARRDARVVAMARVKERAAGQRPVLLDALGADDDADGSESEEDEDVEAQERVLRQEVVDEESESSESEEEDEEVALVTIAAAAKRKRVRKLADEFDRIAASQPEEGSKKQKPAAVTPARASPRRKAAAVASAPAAEAPARASPRRKAATAAADARTSPKRKAAEAPARASPRRKAATAAADARTSPKRKAAEAPAASARRISPRMKH